MYLSNEFVKNQKNINYDESKFDIKPDIYNSFNNFIYDDLYFKYSKKYYYSICKF